LNPSQVLILPGWQNSGLAHWQSRWEALHGYLRVEQHDWMRPLRGDWIARLEEVLLEQAQHHTGPNPQPCVLVAHSLGCQLVAAWAAHSRNTHLVKAALLVAPGDPAGELLRPVLHSWMPVVMQRLPFKSVLLGSQNDPYCSPERAQAFASAWGAEFIDYGAAGHINAESGLGDWPQGHEILMRLKEEGQYT
jgi:predicted alpha/beta hydrolase family esterase